MCCCVVFFFSSRRRHTRCALVTGVQTCALPISRNVADACKDYGVQAMVQVSTDKAVNPVGLMGATKRLGELYCQALDLEGQDDPEAPRFLTVRFGNVIGSSGSLIPLFQRQLRRGSSLTVTHPDIRSEEHTSELQSLMRI